MQNLWRFRCRRVVDLKLPGDANGTSGFSPDCTIESFRFYDEDENEYEFWLPVFSENTKDIYNPHA